ncbi:DUF1569 domain-containing protein [Metabacillus sp. FJAT-52054]|uniref:DUF1569 domain-containing protein n=1 Tax=Metabacillus sediminis TaxID=3117746 RepID=A0ABZ2NGG3_9BACI
MKNIYHLPASEEILTRIDHLKADLRPEWGQMNAAQMLAHCSSFQDLAMGHLSSPRSRLGMIIGRFVKPIFYNEKPLPQNMSTIPEIMVNDEKEFETEKEKLKQKIRTHQKDGPEKYPAAIHPFFGKLTPDQWGKGIYKHLDHHLKQFGV